jgi:Tat protein secretion system quality control protein TatD with DNase activity
MGEMGLDYFHKHTPRDHQHAVFRAQLWIAVSGTCRWSFTAAKRLTTASP